MATKKKFNLDALFTPDNLNFEMVQVLDEEGNRVNNSEKEQAPSDLKGAENETKSTAEKTTSSNEQESVSKQ